jgi:hypothetical protein
MREGRTQTLFALMVLEELHGSERGSASDQLVTEAAFIGLVLIVRVSLVVGIVVILYNKLAGVRGRRR